ncbi:MAG: TPR/glycosyl transferase domain protein [Dehalococcoidia bacterium]|nr:TPR/glycosyl transferase domain protein [Dehalococcoidia bacterium]
MKSVLVVAHFFPPVGGGGVQRTLKFVKYLPSFGWRPVVLTARKSAFGFYDPTLVDEIPVEARVYRTAFLAPGHGYRAFRDLLTSGSPGGQGTRMGWPRKLASSVLRPLFKVLHYTANNLVFVPDYEVGWIPFAVVRGVRVIRSERIDAIYATGNPWSDFLIAYFLSKLTGRPYIMDMRDPWTLSPDLHWGRVRSSIEGFWERRCIMGAAKVINITEQATQAYRDKYPNVEPSKFQCITQGFDPSDFEGVACNQTERFTIGATGTYYEFRTPESFLKAVRSLMDRNPGLMNDIRVRFMGAGGEVVSPLVERYHLAEMVEVLPYGSHRESIEFVMSSDVLLLDFLAHVEGRVNLASTSSRIFEFLASGKTILGLVYPSGAAAELITSTGAGVVADPENTDAVAKTIYALYLQYKSGTLRVNGQPNLERFTRKHLTGRLAQMLDEAIANKG